MDREAIKDFEIQLLLDVLFKLYGYDFRNYADASIKRRILRCLEVCKFHHITEIVLKLLHEGYFLEKLVHELTVGVTALFRDPAIYLALRKHVIPELMSHSFVNIWHAGCSSGEEVYAMAILLKEEGLYDQARLYATDLDSHAVQTAKQGIFPADKMGEYEENYRQAGGKQRFAEYCHIKHDGLHMDPGLQTNMVFSTHNLATDGVFADMHLILCRNVMIYFAPTLQERVFKLFRESLVRGGMLCLGSQESLQFSNVAKQFEIVAADEKIYRKHILPRKKRGKKG